MIEYFPDPYPDEILYSVWARFSDYVQYPSREDVLYELFGYKNRTPIVDLPCSLGYFFNQLPFDHAYALDSLINQHTLFPFYAPFLPLDRRQRLREQMISDNAHAIHARIGSVSYASNAGPSPSLLRYCPTCVEEDRARFGECYWHRLHQARGVEVCHLHNTYLENSTIRTRGDLRSNAKGLISAEQAIHPSIPRIVPASPLNNILTVIAKAVSALLEQPHLPPNGHFIYRQYHVLLAQHNLLTLHGLVRTESLFKAFADYYPSELLDLLHCQIQQRNPSTTWLSELLRISGRIRYPLYHILVIHFLGSTIEAFFSQEVLPYPHPFNDGPWPCLNPVCEHYHLRHIRTCQMSEQVGAGRLVAKFTCDCGFIYSRSGPDHSPEDLFRRDVIFAYGPLWEAKLRELWFDPTIKLQDIADQLGVALITANKQAAKLHLPVPRVSSWTPRSGVKPIRKNAKDRSWYRTQWIALINENPEESITTLWKKLPKVFVWLKTHDDKWLIAHRPSSKQKRKQKNQIPLRFQSPQEYSFSEDAMIRDAQMAGKVRACAQKIIDDLCYPRKVTKRKIYIDTPELAIFNKHKIPPLTTLALKEVTETKEMFALRRISWLRNKCEEERIYLTRREFIQRIHIHNVLHVPSVLHAFNDAMTVLSQPI